MKIELELGVLEKPISEQLGDLLTKQAAFHLDKDNDAINRLVTRGYLSSNSKITMRKKLIKNCVAAIKDKQSDNDCVGEEPKACDYRAQQQQQEEEERK